MSNNCIKKIENEFNTKKMRSKICKVHWRIKVIMHIIQTVSSTEILSSGITHCVKNSLGLNSLGEQVEILSLGSDEYANNYIKFEHRFKSDLGKIPLLHKVGLSSAMKKYILASTSDILHTHGLWMFPNFCKILTLYLLYLHGMLSEEALKFSSMKKVFEFLFQRSFADAKLLLRRQRVVKILEILV